MHIMINRDQYDKTVLPEKVIKRKINVKKPQQNNTAFKSAFARRPSARVDAIPVFIDPDDTRAYYASTSGPMSGEASEEQRNEQNKNE